LVAGWRGSVVVVVVRAEHDVAVIVHVAAFARKGESEG
jgi:hypothetical protein